jgi:hypothetical protein
MRDAGQKNRVVCAGNCPARARHGLPAELVERRMKDHDCTSEDTIADL